MLNFYADGTARVFDRELDGNFLFKVGSQPYFLSYKGGTKVGPATGPNCRFWHEMPNGPRREAVIAKIRALTPWIETIRNTMPKP